jgi:hypothetical protein
MTESIRNNPERFRLIFYNISPSIMDYSSSSSSSSSSSQPASQPASQPQQRQHLSPYNNTEANTSMMVEEAEKLYNKIVKDCVNKIKK